MQWISRAFSKNRGKEKGGNLKKKPTSFAAPIPPAMPFTPGMTAVEADFYLLYYREMQSHYKLSLNPGSHS